MNIAQQIKAKHSSRYVIEIEANKNAISTTSDFEAEEITYTFSDRSTLTICGNDDSTFAVHTS